MTSMSRRDALKTMLAGAAATIGYACRNEPPQEEWFVKPYIAACEDEQKRPAFLASLKQSVPNVARFEYVLRSALGDSYDPRQFAMTVPLIPELTGRGSPSRIRIYPGFFADPTRSGALLATHSLVNHESEHALHYALGVPGIETNRFMNAGAFDDNLFRQVSEVVAHHKHYHALLPYQEETEIHTALLAISKINAQYAECVRERATDEQVLTVVRKHELSRKDPAEPKLFPC